MDEQRARRAIDRANERTNELKDKQNAKEPGKDRRKDMRELGQPQSWRTASSGFGCRRRRRRLVRLFVCLLVRFFCIAGENKAPQHEGASQPEGAETASEITCFPSASRRAQFRSMSHAFMSSSEPPRVTATRGERKRRRRRSYWPSFKLPRQVVAGALVGMNFVEEETPVKQLE